MPKFLQKLGALLGRSTPQRQAASELQTIVHQISHLKTNQSQIPQCIQLCCQALALVDKGSNPDLWAWLHFTLGNSLPHNPKGSPAENLEQSIAHFVKAIEVYARQTYPKNRAQTHYNLAIMYRDRICGERADNLELAIAHCDQALISFARESFPKEWAQTLQLLAYVYWKRIRGERAENLEQAILHYGKALEEYSQKDYPEEWAATQHNLANAYKDRIRGCRSENVEQAIRHFRQALEVSTRQVYPDGWAAVQNDLAVAYRARIRGERAENLEIAITHYKQAFKVFTRQAYPERWAMTQNNLGMAYRDRIRGERADNLEQAIIHFGQALAVSTRQAYPERWARIQNNLAIAYVERIRGERAENLEQAIMYYGQALEVRSKVAYPEQWATTENNLGGAYCDRIHGDRAENIELAITHYRQALEVYTRQAFPVDWAMTQNNLAAAYRDRIKGDRVGNLELAITHYRQALSERMLDRFPADFQQTQRSLGHLYFSESDWAEALAAYQEAMRAEHVLLASAYTEAGRLSETAQTSKLYASAAYALLKLDRPAEALVQLEQGKTRLLSRALALDEVDLSPLPEVDQKALRSERQMIRELEAEMRLPPDTPARRDERVVAEALAQVRSGLNETIARIRADHPRFMPENLDLAKILGLIPKGAALVAPLVTEQGCAVFVVPGGSTAVSLNQVLWLDDFKGGVLQTMLQGQAQGKERGGWQGAYFGSKTNRAAWLECIDATGRALWDRLIGPIAERLASLDARQVLLMPQGGLGLFPLHAAWREVDDVRRYFIDDYTVTWLPSAYVWKVSRDRLHDTARRTRRLLAIVNPTEDLPSTPIEGEHVAQLFGDGKSVVLAGRQATSEAVKQQVKEQSASYLHFACHGFYNWADTMQSGLLLAGRERLTLAQIIGQFNFDSIRLVTLSACETGITDIRQSPDEYQGLPAGFLQAGAPAVVSTLWAVDDLSTMLLMERFYQLHLLGQDIPDALQQAQIWLRDVTASELAARFAAEEDELLAATRMPIETASQYFTRFAEQAPEHCPFAHPFHWAAFTFSGA